MSAQNRGLFFAMSGGEGVGKSTQVALLANRLKSQYPKVVVTREPGGSPSAELIRSLLVTGDPAKFDGRTEALLFAAARAEHLRQTVRPALESASIVLSDRFYADSWAIQGHARGLGASFVSQIHDLACDGFMPDLQLVLYLPDGQGLARSIARMQGQTNAEDRFEKLGPDFHARVADGFRAYVRHHRNTIEIDASGSVESVHERIWQVVERVIDKYRGRLNPAGEPS
ncbi:MAG: dTMP kinase [Nevskiaceae bacterium]|nr:MAG: dTMP kinase [Nevskiaceae bacterium]